MQRTRNTDTACVQLRQDNGGKLLQFLLMTGLKGAGSREGNDARDEEGREYELKSDSPSHKSCHSRQVSEVDWLMAIYEGIELQKIYRMKKENCDSLRTTSGYCSSAA